MKPPDSDSYMHKGLWKLKVQESNKEKTKRNKDAFCWNKQTTEFQGQKGYKTSSVQQKWAVKPQVALVKAPNWSIKTQEGAKPTGNS